MKDIQQLTQKEIDQLTQKEIQMLKAKYDKNFLSHLFYFDNFKFFNN